LNAAAVFKIPGRPIRRDRHRVLPDRMRHCKAIITTVQGIGPQLSAKFTSINNSLK
jgi:hypothetical protein